MSIFNDVIVCLNVTSQFYVTFLFILFYQRTFHISTNTNSTLHLETLLYWSHDRDDVGIVHSAELWMSWC